jgi:hypothetical protein
MHRLLLVLALLMMPTCATGLRSNAALIPPSATMWKMTPADSLQVFVVDAERSTPVLGVVITLTTADGLSHALPESAVQFNGLEGRVMVSVRAPSYTSQRLWLDPGQVVVIRLSPSRRALSQPFLAAPSRGKELLCVRNP